MPPIEQAGQRVGGRHACQSPVGPGHRHHVIHGQVGKHQENGREVKDIDGQQRVGRNRLQWLNKPHQHVQTDVIAPQADRQSPGAALAHGGKQRRNEHQQEVMETAVPANQHRSQCRMHQHFGADQHDSQAVATIAESTIGPNVHADADHVDPGQNRRTKPKEDKKETDVDRACQLTTTHGQGPELGTLLTAVHIRAVFM